MAAADALGGHWNVRVLGVLEARNGQLVLTRFVSQPIGALLALLALQPQRKHPREELVERLWPGVALDVGRNRLRNAISSLRRMLEPPGVAGGSVLLADRQSVSLAPGACTCDALEFEQAVRAGHGERALALYRGELLPGFYEDWVQDERTRLTALFDRISEAATVPAAPAAPGQPAAPAAPAREPLSDASPAWPAASPALPSYLTTFFGRDAERAQLRALTAAHRLVTLHGVGGCGKTRLAVEVARTAEGFGRVAFAALADCRDAVQAMAQLRAALQVTSAGGDPLDEVIAALRDQRSLLVLDNFEQLVQHGGVPVVEALLARAPELHVLVTTRRVLGLAGEHEIALQPLPQPDPDSGIEQIARSASVSLFVDRARSVRPDFQVTTRNVESLVTLCSALEGLPLAIELAASRSRAFSPGDMHAALTQRFSLLARSSGTRAGKAAARHDSLRGAIDWSWQLLQPRQQRFLLALSAFRGGWSAPGAQAVCDEPQAHELLEALTADSLLRSDADARGAMRFFMLEMIREYLRDHLRAHVPEADVLVLRQRHRAYFLARALALGQRSQAAERDELPNFVEALQTAVDDAEPALALALGVALRGEWEQHGMSAPVAMLLERALAQLSAQVLGQDPVLGHAQGHAQVHAKVHAQGLTQGQAEGQAPGQAPEVSPWVAPGTRALLVQSHLVLRGARLVAGLSDVAQAHVVQALHLAGQQPELRAAALLGDARQRWERSRDAETLRPLLDEALRLARAESAVELEAGVLSTLATVTFHGDDRPVEAIAMFAQAQRLYEAAGIEHLANRMLFTQANCHAKLHQYAPALSLLEECEQRFNAAGDVKGLPELANVQGFLYANMVRWRDAERAFARCATLSARVQNRYMMAFGLWNLSRPLAHRRRCEASAMLMAFSIRYWTTNFGELVSADLRHVEQVRRLIRVQIGAAELERHWQRARLMSLPEALELAAQSLDPAV